MNGHFRKEGASEPYYGFPTHQYVQATGWGDEFAEKDGFHFPGNKSEVSPSRDLSSQMRNLAMDPPMIGIVEADSSTHQLRPGARIEDMIAIQDKPGYHSKVDRKTTLGILAAMQSWSEGTLNDPHIKITKIRDVENLSPDESTVAMAGFIPQMDPRRASRLQRPPRVVYPPGNLVSLPVLGPPRSVPSIQFQVLPVVQPSVILPEAYATSYPRGPAPSDLPVPLHVLLPKMAQLEIKDTHRVPWNYQVTPEQAVSETVVDEIGGMTRSGRCYTPEELERRRKGKAKEGEEVAPPPPTISG